MAIFNGCSSNLICTLIYLCSPQRGAWARRLISAQQGLNDLVISHKQLRKCHLPSLNLAIREDKGQQQTQPSRPTPRASVSTLLQASNTMRDLEALSGGPNQLDLGKVGFSCWAELSSSKIPSDPGPCKSHNPLPHFSQSSEAPSQLDQLFPLWGQARTPQPSQSHHLLLLFEHCHTVTHWFCSHPTVALMRPSLFPCC